MEILNMLLEFIFPRSRKEHIALETSYGQLMSDARGSVNDSILMELGAMSVFEYRDPLIRQLMWLLKYRRKVSVAERFGEVLAEHLIEELSVRNLFGDMNDVLIVPIPISKKRMRERGFNQVELIAKTLIEQIPELTIAPDVLKRVNDTEHQARVRSKRARAKNVKECFFVENSHEIMNRDLLLLDDVITTGATMREAIDTLRAAGAQSILPVSVAH